MRLIQIARYPVKSLQGELLDTAVIEADGLHADRMWGIRDEPSGRLLTARREPRLLFAAARLAAGGALVVTLPTGTECHGEGRDTDAALTGWLGRPVRLVKAIGAPAARAEYFADATDDRSEAIEWTMPANRFVDAMPLLVLTTASLRTAAALHADGDWDLRRFRPNLVVDVPGDGWVEDGWCAGRELQIGEAIVEPSQPCIRCTMVTRPQRALGDDRDIFRTLARNHSGHFGAWSTVGRSGTVRVGDEVLVRPALSGAAV
jgi:uncharacterized protein YcbX